MVIKKYPRAFRPNELAPTYSFLDFFSNEVSFPLLVARIQHGCGLVLSPAAIKELSSFEMGSFIFLVSDIVEIRTIAKHMNVVEYAEFQSILYSGLSSEGAAAERLFALAADMLKDPGFKMVALLPFGFLIDCLVFLSRNVGSYGPASERRLNLPLPQRSSQQSS